MPARETAIGDRGMVASISPRAAAAGIRVLQDGGNAFDAAIAVASMEWLTTPENCGLGGDTFAVLYDAKLDRLVAISGSGVSGARATREAYISQGLSGMPLDGWHAAAVMGTPDAYATLNRQFGTRPLADLLAPALDVAERGVIVSASMSGAIAATAAKLNLDDRAASIFLPGGSVPQTGDRLALPDLARSLRTLAQEGSEPFYTGAIAAEIVRASQEADGPFEAADFAGHTTDVGEPISTTYRGVEVYQTAPPSQGLVTLEWLNLLEGDDLAALGFGSAEAIHLLAETKKLAFADRLRYAGDRRFVPDQVEALLSKQFAAERRKAVDLKRACPAPTAGSLPEQGGDTSYFAVADGEGNAISFIHSMSAWFGCGVAAGDTGILLNNRAGRGFYLDPPDHVNVIAPGKKTMHTLNCYMLCRDGRPWIVGGTPGGDRQVQWNVQAITNIIDHEMSIGEVVEAPAWISWPGSDPAEIHAPFELQLEGRFDGTVATALEARGHSVVKVGDYGLGSRHQFILLDEAGILHGATDPRVPGVALGI
jgi:gamma-glutamyltranspeptidase/glutathione hydrolase